MRTSRRRSGRSRSSKPLAARALNIERLEDRCLLAVFSPLASATDGDSGSFRSAVIASQSNQADDTIRLEGGIYTLRLGDLRIDERDTNLRIEGAGSDRTVIKVEGENRAFDVDFNARLEVVGLSILSGSADEGGQLRSAGTVVVHDANLQGGTAIQGGSIFNGGDLTLTNVEFVANEAGVGGAIWNHAGATLTAIDTRWTHNLTSTRLGELINSPAQVGINLVGSDSPGSMVALPPRGGTALFNAGIAHLQSVEIAGNLSETGSTIHNVGDAAELRIDDSLIYENESTIVTGENVATSVLLAMRGTVDLVQTAVFNNSSRHVYGTIGVFAGTIDMERVSMFDNSAPRHGFKAMQSNVRMDHVTMVRNGSQGAELVEAPHTVISITASAIDSIRLVPREGQFLSGGGNRFVFAQVGFTSEELFDHPTDLEMPNDVKEKYFFAGQSFDFLPAGVYQERVALPPTSSSQLNDALPDGSDAGAFEYVAGLERKAGLPTVQANALTLQEDGEPLLIESLVPDATGAVAAQGTISTNAQGELVYRTEPDFEGDDRLVVERSDGQMHSWAVFVEPQPDPPTIEDYVVTVLGRGEILGLATPGASHETDLNAVTASYQRDSLFIPNGNPSPGPDLGSVIEAQGFVIDGQLDLGPDLTSALPEEFGGQLPYLLGAFAAQPKVNLKYVPEPGFSGTDTRTVRVVNSAGLSADATATFRVLDPNDHPALGRLTARFLDEDLQLIDTVRVGENFYVEYSIEDVRDDEHPLPSLQRDFFAVDTILNIGGAPLRIGRRPVTPGPFPPLGDGTIEIPPQVVGGFVDIPTPPTQLGDTNLRFDVETFAFERRSGPFYRVAVQATGAGTITADAPFVSASGLGMRGDIPHDWFDVVTSSVQVVASRTNMNQREDVNQDGSVSSIDALIVINELNDQGAGEASAEPPDNPTQMLWDVNGDGALSPNDALQVINYINQQVSTADLAEGEARSIITPHASPITTSEFRPGVVPPRLDYQVGRLLRSVGRTVTDTSGQHRHTVVQDEEDGHLLRARLIDGVILADDLLDVLRSHDELL